MPPTAELGRPRCRLSRCRACRACRACRPAHWYQHHNTTACLGATGSTTALLHAPSQRRPANAVDVQRLRHGLTSAPPSRRVAPARAASRARRAGGREIRSGIRYQAYKSLIIDGRPFFRRTEFVAPKLEPSKELYQLTLVLPTPPKARPIPAPMPFQLEGTAPRTDPENKMLHISYFFKGREVPSETYVVNGKSFKFGVESLGGDLVFSDIDRRIVYGFNLAVDSPKIGEVVTIRGHRKYTVTRSVSKSAEAVTFFPLDQKRIPLSVAVFPPGASETEVLVVPGKYQIRFTEVPKRENSKEMPASDIELGDAPIIRLR